MLPLLFDWLDRHPSSYWLIVSGPTLLLLVWTAWAARADRRPPAAPAENRAWGAFVLLLFLLAWRWPWLLHPQQFSPDESQHVAGILTLADDPVFFRSVDGSTAGPLNFYLPLPLGLLLGRIDYFTVRLAGLLLVWGTLFFCHRAAVRLAGVTPARLGLLPAAFFYATTTDWEFLHYSTEHAPLFLFSLCLWSLAQVPAAKCPTGWLVTAGVAAGLSPWAKLQIGPLSAVLVVAGLWQIASTAAPGRTRWRQGLILCLSTLAPTVLAVILLAPFGLVETAYLRYVHQNLFYVHEGQLEPGSVQRLAQLAWASRWFPVFAAGPLLLAATAGLIALGRFRPVSRLYLGGAALTAVAVLSVVLPGRPFQHYLLLLVIPVMLWGITAAHELWGHFHGSGARRVLVPALLLLGTGPLILLRLAQPVPSMFGLFAEFQRHPRLEADALIHDLAQPGDQLALWGYAPQVYAATGLAQGTRDSYSYWSIAPSSRRDTYRAVFLEDLRRNRPAFFVDAVGPGSHYYPDRERQGHGTFPELADYVAAHYQPVAARQNLHIYVRRDLLAERTRTSPEFRAALRRASADPAADISPEALTAVNGRREMLGDGPVIILAPPASLSCELSGTERELQLDYGFHPLAAAARASDGANLVVEIVSPDHPAQPVFRRFLEAVAPPGVTPDNRLGIPLPPFPPRSRLVLATDPGPANRSDWDWIYVSRLRLRRSPAYLPAQFPGFNRAPESATAATTYRMGAPGVELLMQHAPAQNVFRLNGNERTLTFAFGLLDGAYAGANRTDGAIFRVERHRGAARPVVLFERRLDPLAHPADRGRQQCSLPLVDVAPDDRLVVVIDPAGHAAWDWTYLAELTLE